MPARVTKLPISTNRGTTDKVYEEMSMISVATADIAAGQERIRPSPIPPTPAIASAMGTRSSIRANIAAKPMSPSIMGRIRSTVLFDPAQGQQEVARARQRQHDRDQVLEGAERDAELRGHVAVLESAGRAQVHHPGAAEEQRRGHEVGDHVLPATQPGRNDAVEQVEHDVLAGDRSQRQGEEDRQQHRDLGVLETAGERGLDELAPDPVVEGQDYTHYLG